MDTIVRLLGTQHLDATTMKRHTCRAASLAVVFLCYVLVTFAAMVSAVGADATPTVKPNIVLILIDDMGWADGGCFGSKFYRTPNLDRLAAAGMRFTQAYASCAVCSPTRAAIMTGKSPARLHITDWIPGEAAPANSRFRLPDWQQHLPLEETTLAKALKRLGYATALIGKWHLGGPEFHPQHQGFDLNIAGGDIGSPVSVCDVPVISHDLFPTALELAGVGKPARTAEIDGASIVPLLRGQPTLPRHELFWHYPHYWNGGKVSPYSVVRVGDWKLIRFYESGNEELYNLRDDLSERHDLAGSQPAKRRQLAARLDAWLKEVGAQLPVQKRV